MQVVIFCFNKSSYHLSPDIRTSLSSVLKRNAGGYHLSTGWMQVVILCYHVTGSSQHIGRYVHLRALVSAYLFLTGYGHTLLAWRAGAPGMGRYAQVRSID